MKKAGKFPIVRQASVEPTLKKRVNEYLDENYLHISTFIAFALKEYLKQENPQLLSPEDCDIPFYEGKFDKLFFRVSIDQNEKVSCLAQKINKPFSFIVHQAILNFLINKR